MRNPRGVGGVGGWGRSLTPHTPSAYTMREKSGFTYSLFPFSFVICVPVIMLFTTI
ncbi:MAG: hypothetical protein V7K61_30145 [Nostoc sp.]